MKTITCTTEKTEAGKTRLVQTYGSARVTRYKANPDNGRPPGFLVDDQRKGKYFVPYGIAALTAGKDAWMRDLQAKCWCCGANFRVGDVDTTNGEICPRCTTEAEDENARLDGEES